MDAFSGKIAVVTGGASGIGRAVAKALARRGATVVVADRDGEAAETTARALVEGGGKARAERVDVADAAQVKALVDGTFEREGRLDLLFNNAGIALFGEVRDMTLEQWVRLFRVNIDGVMHGVVAAYPRMVAQGSGHIVNTASMAGLVPTSAPPPTPPPSTRWSGSTSLRGEGADLGVRVSVVCPGLIDTLLKDTLTYLELDKTKMLGDPAVRLYDVDSCAADILRGVERNRAIIPVTLFARGSWWTARIAPGFMATTLGRLAMRRLRKRYVATPPATGPAR